MTNLISRARFIAEARTLIPELIAALEQFQWQPIETAKRDEMRSVLLLTPEGIQIGWWSDRAANWLADDGEYLWADPTHWMPLPPAPEVVK